MYQLKQVVNIHANFGTLQATTYSLLRSMLGGINWGILCDMLLAMDTLSPMLFIFYVLFALLAVLNIVTGVFVDNAVAAAKTQREFIIEREREIKEKYVRELQDLFLEMDEDASGTLTAEEMQQLVKDPKMSAYFSALGFEAHDCIRLFSLLDTDGSGSVDIEEFLDGCLRLKGMARSIDVHFIMVQIHRLQKQLSGLETGHSAVVARLLRQRSRDLQSSRLTRPESSWVS
ncbi:Scn11a [Symbiodinium natans]|uniref:Scn11a protein n=1 Tax=Symbiodinium natans TaxID=878477 RepID=A0A812I1U3_9DINO|nr:Scn11a [Symbiodinium natans]